MPNGLTEIVGSAFNGCSHLSGLIIPDSVTEIGNMAFYGCISLESLDIPKGVTKIGNSTFSGCKHLETVTIPESVTVIGEYAFSGCDDLREVKVNDVNAYAQVMFASNSANPLYYAGNLLVGDAQEPVKHLVVNTTPKAYAFYGATCLERVRVKADNIGTKAFNACSNITDLCLETSEIASKAFSGCTGVKNVYVPLQEPPTAPADVFVTYDGVTLYVPMGCKEVYASAPGCWAYFTNIIECDFDDLDTIFAPDYSNIEVGVEDIEMDFNGNDASAGPKDIYTMQGVLLKRNASAEDVKALAPGLYIVGGKKVLVK